MTGAVALQHVQAVPEQTTIGPFDQPAAADTQPMPDGNTLTVTDRGHATVRDPAGEVVAEAQFGRHVVHVLTTPAGYVWVGYIDQGIFGVDGPGAHGLVRFAPDLTLDWACPEGLVSDCYALNVDGETAWACPYADFPVLRIKDGVLRQWENPVAGAHGLLVRGSRVALIGGYHLPHDRLTTGDLRDDFRPTAEWTLTLPDDRPLPPDTRFTCRGPDLHAMTGGNWYHFDLANLPG